MDLEAAFASQSQYIVTHNLKHFMDKGIVDSMGITPLSAQHNLKELGEE